jgi:hypothetical protein
MKTHELKLVNPYFQDVWNKSKTFEVRRNDRKFEVGDFVILKEFDKEKNTFLKRVVKVEITYILSDFEALDKEFVIFGFNIIQRFTLKPLKK